MGSVLAVNLGLACLECLNAFYVLQFSCLLLLTASAGMRQAYAAQTIGKPKSKHVLMSFSSRRKAKQNGNQSDSHAQTSCFALHGI